MKFKKAFALGLALFFSACVKPMHTMPFEDKYNQMDAPVEVQNEYLEALEKLGSFQSEVTPFHTPSSWTYQGVSCTLNTKAPEDEGWALFLETEKGCPYQVHLSIKFGYNILLGEVTSDFRTFFKPSKDNDQISFDLRGKGYFHFATKSEGTQVEGDYSLSGILKVSGKPYNLTFSNEVHAVEAHGELLKGQTYSTLALGTKDWEMGARSLVGHNYGEQTERHQLNREVVSAKLSEQIFSQLSIFSPKSVSTIGRIYVESQK
jgi:hypothetical protein